MRQARLPWGTSSNSISPALYSPSNTQESAWRGKEQTIFLTRLVLSRAASPVSPLPALLFTMVRFFAPRGDQRVDQLGRHARRTEPADHHRRPIVDVGNRRLQ